MSQQCLTHSISLHSTQVNNLTEKNHLLRISEEEMMRNMKIVEMQLDAERKTTQATYHELSEKIAAKDTEIQQLHKELSLLREYKSTRDTIDESLYYY